MDKEQEQENPRAKQREIHKNCPQLNYWDQCKVTDWFYKDQIVWIEDIRDTIPEWNPNPEDKEFFVTYYCRVGQFNSWTWRIIEGKYLRLCVPDEKNADTENILKNKGTPITRRQRFINWLFN